MDREGSAGPSFPLPSSTPAQSTYPCQAGTQHEKNNFRPRKFRRIPSSTESTAALRRTLQKYWGHGDFRGPQLDICDHALRGCDVLVVAPTGLGKSVCFQVPAVTIEYGITIVISPLLALIRDQVSSLRSKGIMAYQLSEKTDQNDVQEIRRQLRMGHPQLRLLYVTPETLFSAKYAIDFDIAYRQRQIVRLVVDEAHVIDEWGSTFRPTYRRLGEFRVKYPLVPITALTASATADVRDDMTTILNMPKTAEGGLAQWVEPFNRRNLFYEIRHQGGGDRAYETVNDLTNFIKGYQREAKATNKRYGVTMPCVSGLVYCRYKADCDSVSHVLSQNGISAMPFYASLSENKRNETLDMWKAGQVECIVATIAFGMGVDQAHVRYVVHYDMPKSFEGYYQETGRAGRDGHMSRCVLYYAREDALRLRGLVSKEGDRAAKDGQDPAALERGKLRTLNSFKAFYAESISICRHVAICRYFGEEIDQITDEIKDKYCSGMCDVCANRTGVFMRAERLSEEVETASPIIRPRRLEPRPEYVALSTQAARHSLAAFHGLSGTEAGDGFDDLPALDDIPEIFVPPLRHAGVPPRVFPRQPKRTLSRQLSAMGPGSRTGGRAQTMDQLADEGFVGAVAVYGEPRSPDHAEKKRKAREAAFKDVTPASGGGPFSFYNSSAPRKKARLGGTQFKVPSMAPPGSVALPSIAPSTTEPSLPAPSSVPPSAMETSQGPDRGKALQRLQDALKLSFGTGDLADQVLAHWGRKEAGEKRLQLIRRVARELELDMAKVARDGEPYTAVVHDTCEAVKLVRARRGATLVIEGKLAHSADTRVERLRHVETCFKTVR